MIVVTNKNVYWVKGYKRSILYDLRNRIANLHWLDEEATIAINKAIKKQNISPKEEEFIEELKKVNLFNEKRLNVFKPDYKNKNFSLKFVWIEVTNKCNQRCIHCYGNFHYKQETFIDSDDYERIINELKQLECTNIQLIGGEPFLHSQIWQFIQIAKENNMDIEIFTNGSLISEKDINDIKERDVKIALSIYGGPNEFKKITGDCEIYYKILKVIELLKKYQIKFRLAYIETIYNSNSNDRIIKENKDFIKKDVVRISGRATLALLNEKLIEKKLISLYNFKFPIKSNIIYNNFFYHQCFSKKIYISSELNVYPCVMERRLKYGNIKRESISTILSRNRQYAYLTKDFIEDCKDCEFRYACFDCRPDSINNNFYAKPWYCVYNPYTGKWKDV